MVETERASNGNGPISGLNCVARTKRNTGKVFRWYFDQCEVREAISSDYLSIKGPVVIESDLNILGVDHVIIRQNVAIRTNNDSGSGSATFELAFAIFVLK